jgi:hypothetical protein
MAEQESQNKNYPAKLLLKLTKCKLKLKIAINNNLFFINLLDFYSFFDFYYFLFLNLKKINQTKQLNNLF